jgi:membrane-bound serine protease (ClpP class)
VFVIPIEKEIEPGLVTFIKRAVKEAESKNPKALIFEINTFGGQVESALEIVEIISAVKVPTLAYVKEKAISAGALIALACNDLVMEENTTIGDVAPIMVSQGGPVMMGEKFQSPLRAKFRSLAQKNNYPVKLSESFVSTEKEIVEVWYKDSSTALLTGVEYGDLSEQEKKSIVRKKTIVPKGELLTLSASEALELGFSRKTVSNIREALTYLGIEDIQPVRINKKRSENFLITFNKIAPILLMIGLFGIYMEIKTPGFGIFGIVGIAAFLLFFGTKHIVGLADHIELTLFVLGITLLAVELFVLPGFGIFGVLGIGLMLAAALLAMQSFTIPRMPWEKIAFKRNLLIVGSMFAASVPIFIVTLFSASRALKIAGLGHTQTESVDAGFRPASEDYAKLVGTSGTTATPLRTAGSAIINGIRYDVVSDGSYVDEGVDVKVTEVIGNRIIVSRV